MLRGASEIFGRPRRTCHFCIYCGAKFRNGHCHAKRTFESQIEVDGMGRLIIRSVWGYMRNCAYRRSVLCCFSPQNSEAQVPGSLKGPKVRSRSKYEEALSDLGRMAPARSRLAPPIRDWLYKTGPARGYHSSRPADLERTCRYRYPDSTPLWISSFGSNVNSPYSKTVCSRERALK